MEGHQLEKGGRARAAGSDSGSNSSKWDQRTTLPDGQTDGRMEGRQNVRGLSGGGHLGAALSLSFSLSDVMSLLPHLPSRRLETSKSQNIHKKRVTFRN